MLSKKQRRELLKQSTQDMGKQLYNLRIKSGLSPEEIEKKYQILANNLLTIETGTTNIQLQFIAYLASVYDKKLKIKIVDVDDIE